jgi:uncharacterized protein YcbK (DUF882 family)
MSYRPFRRFSSVISALWLIHETMTVLSIIVVLVVLGISLNRTYRASASLERFVSVSSSTVLADNPNGNGFVTHSVEVPSNAPSPYSGLLPITIYNVNTKESVHLRLYDSEGRVREREAIAIDQILADSRRKGKAITRKIDRRLLQVMVRSAYYFHKTHIEIVSGYRAPLRRREGYHGLGRAADYRISGITAAELARYLRQIPRLGVGVYTHPKTQFVHLDVRDESFHWLDASPPRRRWRERSIGGPWLAELDKKYVRSDDWPEGFSPPSTDTK